MTIPNLERIRTMVTSTRVLYDLLLEHRRFKDNPLQVPGFEHGYSDSERRMANDLHTKTLERRIREECAKAGIDP